MNIAPVIVELLFCEIGAFPEEGGDAVDGFRLRHCGCERYGRGEEMTMIFRTTRT